MLAGGFGSLLSPKFEKLIGTRNIIYLSMLAMPIMMFIFVYATPRMPVLALIDFVLMAFVLMLKRFLLGYCWWNSKWIRICCTKIWSTSNPTYRKHITCIERIFC